MTVLPTTSPPQPRVTRTGELSRLHRARCRLRLGLAVVFTFVRLKKMLVTTAVVTFTTLGLLFFGVTPAEAAPGTVATIKVGPSGTRVRSTLDINSKTNIVGGLHNGATVRVYCVTTGPFVTGPYGTTDVWNRIGTRRYVSATFTGVKAGSGCFDKQTSEPARTTGTSGARVNVNGLARVRSEPSTGALVKHRYDDETPVKLSCQTFAEGRWWVKLASGAGYIAAELVSGVSPTLEQCPGKTPREDQGEKQDPPKTSGERQRAETAPCSLGGSEKEVYELMFGAACVDNKEVFGPDPGDDDDDYPNELQDPSCDRPTCRFEARRPFYIEDIGPNGEGSYGIRWDGCSVPEQAALIPGMGDVSHPFGFDFINACHVHDFGYRLIDRHILPESAEEALDTFFARMLGRICLNYPDRIAACREVALVYSTAVMTADHKPKRDDYPRVYTGPR